MRQRTMFAKNIAKRVSPAKVAMKILIRSLPASRNAQINMIKRSEPRQDGNCTRAKNIRIKYDSAFNETGIRIIATRN